MKSITIDDLNITELPSPPQGALAVVHACAKDEFDANRIGELVSHVPTLSVELLRLSNSAYFGFAGEVTSISRAITLIGHRVLKNVALCIAMKATLRPEQMPAFPIDTFWEASLRRGVCARVLADEIKFDREAGFTAGLLQDFGLLVLFYLNPHQVNEWLRFTNLTPDARYELERQLFNMTHDQLGEQLAQHWELPDELAVALGCHHQGPPDDASEVAEELCKLAQCADWMSAVFTSENRREAIKRSRSLMMDYYRLTIEQVNQVMERVAEGMQEAATAFGFQVGEQSSYESLIGEANLHLVEENMSFQQMNWHLEHTLEERDRVAAELNRELELAREVQRSLLPDDSRHAGDITGLNVSAKAVSGDFYDFFTLRTGSIAFCIADVSGKGMNAAILMAKASSLFHCLAKSIHDPSKLLMMLNREILETSIHGMFVTMLAGVYDPKARVIRMANAGHLPAILMRGAEKVNDFPAQAPPLGIIPDVMFPAEEIRLEPNQQLYLYTDGLLEAKMAGDEILEEEGLLALLSKYADVDSEERLRHIVSDLQSQGGSIHDDLTLLLVDG